MATFKVEMTDEALAALDNLKEKLQVKTRSSVFVSAVDLLEDIVDTLHSGGVVSMKKPGARDLEVRLPCDHPSRSKTAEPLDEDEQSRNSKKSAMVTGTKVTEEGGV